MKDSNLKIEEIEVYQKENQEDCKIITLLIYI